MLATMMSLSEKIVANRQKRNWMQMHEDIKDRHLADSVVRPIYYPESSHLLNTVLKNMHDGRWQKTSYLPPSADYEDKLATRLATLSSRENTVLCFFPDYSARMDGVISELPVLEVAGSTIEKWYQFAKGKGLDFFLSSSTDLRSGVVLDVYEADPVVHRTAGAVRDLYAWGA
jgi:hypothetical protein